MGLSRSGYYYEPVPESEENLALMRRLDELNLAHPVYGSRRLRALLAREGCVVNRKRVVRLLGLLGIEAVYPKRHLSQPGEGHRIYPYLLEGLEITGPDQVWCSDINPPGQTLRDCRWGLAAQTRRGTANRSHGQSPVGAGENGAGQT